MNHGEERLLEGIAEKVGGEQRVEVEERPAVEASLGGGFEQ